MGLEYKTVTMRKFWEDGLKHPKELTEVHTIDHLRLTITLRWWVPDRRKYWGVLGVVGAVLVSAAYLVLL
jgi:hypothetical protein